MHTGTSGTQAQWESEAGIRGAAHAMKERPARFSIPGWESRPGDVAKAIVARALATMGMPTSFDAYRMRDLQQAECALWEETPNPCSTCSMTARVVEGELKGWGVPRSTVWRAWVVVALAELRHLQAGPCDCGGPR